MNNHRDDETRSDGKRTSVVYMIYKVWSNGDGLTMYKFLGSYPTQEQSTIRVNEKEMKYSITKQSLNDVEFYPVHHSISKEHVYFVGKRSDCLAKMTLNLSYGVGGYIIERMDIST